MYSTIHVDLFRLTVKEYGVDHEETRRIQSKLVDYRSRVLYQYSAICFILIKGISFSEQHDQNFQSPSPGLGPSNNPSESFFIDRLGEHLNVTGRMLRVKEDEVFIHERYSEDAKAENYWSRDFAHLCRGIKLVNVTNTPFP